MSYLIVHVYENPFMLMGIRGIFLMKHFAVKKYWKVLKGPQVVTERCEWEGWDLDAVKGIFRSSSFFADSINNLLIVYSLPVLQAT